MREKIEKEKHFYDAHRLWPSNSLIMNRNYKMHFIICSHLFNVCMWLTLLWILLIFFLILISSSQRGHTYTNFSVCDRPLAKKRWIRKENFLSRRLPFFCSVVGLPCIFYYSLFSFLLLQILFCAHWKLKTGFLRINF